MLVVVILAFTVFAEMCTSAGFAPPLLPVADGIAFAGYLIFVAEIFVRFYTTGLAYLSFSSYLSARACSYCSSQEVLSEGCFKHFLEYLRVFNSVSSLPTTVVY